MCRTSFQISSGKLQKFTCNGVDNWFNIQLTNWHNVSFIGKEWYVYLIIYLFFVASADYEICWIKEYLEYYC